MTLTTYDLNDKLRNLMADLLPVTVQPRYRYWKGPHGERYCYTTEKVNGKFVCWTYQPYGAGSRSGKPKAWKLTDRVEFTKRKTARARAYARLQKAKAKHDQA